MDRIRPVKTSGGLKACVYGQIRTGKTTLAATFPKPLLIMGTEDGTKSVSDVEGVSFIRLKSSKDVEDLYHDILRHGHFASVALDTAKGLEDIVYGEVLGMNGIPVTKSFGVDVRIYSDIAARFKEVIKPVLDLCDSEMALNLAILAHERKIIKEEDPIIPGIPYMGAAVTPALGGWIGNESDLVAYAYRRTRTKIVAAKDTKGNPIQKKVNTGEYDYCLRVGYDEVHTTGVRKPRSVTAREDITDPDYAKIRSLVFGE